MMTNKQIKELVQILDESSLTDLEIHADKEKIILRKQVATVMAAPAPAIYHAPAASPAVPEPSRGAAPAAPAAASGIDPKWKAIKSPIVGTFYRSPAPDAPPFVKEGQKISAGAVVCIVEAMKIMNEIKSEISGTVQKVTAENAHPVEFDAVLFWVLPD
jgi:acetyl-CoA carboxylase biotin carboxyl carrier protein